jgi:hypothetical protein
VPVIAGAFVDPSAADVPGTSSPAERAAHISRPHLPHKAPAAEPKRRPRWRTPALVIGIIAVLVAVLAGVYAWTQSYYFVGRDGTEVAIFRGVNTSFGPLKFYEVNENTDLKVSDLEQSSRSQVVSGIAASSKSEARQIVDRLASDHLLPLCAVTSTSTPSATSKPSASITITPKLTPTAHKATTPAAGKTTAGRTASRTPTVHPTTSQPPTTTPAPPTNTPASGECRS